MDVYYDELLSPIGPLTVIMKEDIVIRIDFGTLESVKEKVVIWCQRYVGEPVFIHQPEKIVRVEQELKEYFAGSRDAFTFAYMFYGTPFQKYVWTVLMSDLMFGDASYYKYCAR